MMSRWGVIEPDFSHFMDKAKTHRVIPVVKKIFVDDPTPVGIYRRLAKGTGTFILESADTVDHMSRWSFIGVRSVAQLISEAGALKWEGTFVEGVETQGKPIDVLTELVSALNSSSDSHYPPFTGGFVGALGWDTLYDWEPNLRHETNKDVDIPDAVMCLATDIVAIDRREGTVWLISNAINMNNTSLGAEKAYASAF